LVWGAQREQRKGGVWLEKRVPERLRCGKISKMWLCARKSVAYHQKSVAEYGSAEKSLRAHNLLEGMAGSQGMWVADGKRVEKVMILNLS